MNSSASIDFEPIIWARVLEARVTARGEISPDVAHFLLGMGFSESDRERIAYLSRRSQDGELPPGEQAEYDSYLHIGNILTIMKAKARLILGVPPTAPSLA